MPKSWRTDTFMSGMPGTPAWAWAGIAIGFRMLLPVPAEVAAPDRPKDNEYRRLQASDEASLLQIVISLDDFAQPVLGPLIPAIGVGMVALYQFLELGLDLNPVHALC